MKPLLKKIVVFFSTMMMVNSVLYAGLSSSKSETVAGKDVKILSMISAVTYSRIFIQTVAKDYLYIGNDVATTKAKKEMAVALKKFDRQQKNLANALTDPTIENLMMPIKMNVDELKDALKKPYSIDHAREVIDLAETISEGNKKIAGMLKKKLSKDYPTDKEQRYMIAQIAKYYMAYASGIKDENTVHSVKKMVQKFDKSLQEMKAYPKNTVKMNQLVNETDQLWKIVKQFYEDIEARGLPIIVYQTTKRIDQAILDYSQRLKNITSIHKGYR